MPVPGQPLPKLFWPSQAGPERIAYNDAIRKRYTDTNGEGMEEEERKRAEILVERDERKRLKRAQSQVKGAFASVKRSSKKQDTGAATAAATVTAAVMQEQGAWICPGCKNENYASRQTCHSKTCNERRPAVATQSAPKAPAPKNLKPSKETAPATETQPKKKKLSKEGRKRERERLGLGIPEPTKKKQRGDDPTDGIDLSAMSKAELIAKIKALDAGANEGFMSKKNKKKKKKNKEKDSKKVNKGDTAE